LNYSCDTLDILRSNELFDKIDSSEIEHLLTCLDTKIHKYKKNQFIWMQGDSNHKVSIVLSGQVNILKEDVSGNRNLIASIIPPAIFGESLVCSEISFSPVSAQVAEDTTIITLEFLKLINTCENSCGFHNRLIQNMLKIIAIKNINLNKKLDYLSKKTTQQKLASYILDSITNKDNLLISIPFSRDELADFLGVNRSALSRELSKMRDNNILNFNKNIFHITDLERLVDIAND
jgi:CRP-like cAMP-binding protein